MELDKDYFPSHNHSVPEIKYQSSTNTYGVNNLNYNYSGTMASEYGNHTTNYLSGKSNQSGRPTNKYLVRVHKHNESSGENHSILSENAYLDTQYNKNLNDNLDSTDLNVNATVQLPFEEGIGIPSSRVLVQPASHKLKAAIRYL